jgi:hypothetical protein
LRQFLLEFSAENERFQKEKYKRTYILKQWKKDIIGFALNAIICPSLAWIIFEGRIDLWAVTMGIVLSYHFAYLVLTLPASWLSGSAGLVDLPIEVFVMCAVVLICITTALICIYFTLSKGSTAARVVGHFFLAIYFFSAPFLFSITIPTT